MLATLNDARNSALRNIAGACSNSPEFLQLLNDATRQLMRRGDWAGTVQPIYACVKNGCLVWPRYVGSVRKLNWCRRPLEVRGLWWEFLSHDHYASLCGSAMSPGMNAQGHSPVQQDIAGANRLVRVYADAAADAGKSVMIFGLDGDGQPLKTQAANGTWTPGIVITMAAPFGSSTGYVSRIDRVLKDETNGPVRLYAYDAVNDVLEDLATYEPSETNPDYARYKLAGPKCGSGCCGGTSHGVTALVKLKFIPAKLDTDLVLIQNLDALKDMMQAIKFKEANDIGAAREYELAAIRELNLELADETPNAQIAVSAQPFNGLNFGNRCF